MDSGVRFLHVRVLALGVGVILLSLALTFLNSYLMTQGNFPYAMPILLCHTMFSSVCAGCMYKARPHIFTSLAREEFNLRFVLKGGFPIAVAFMLVNVLNSVSLRYSGPAFLTMMKKGGLMVIYGFSISSGLEPHRWGKTLVVVALVPAMMLTIDGEVDTSFFGVLICASCVLLDAAKNILQALVLCKDAGWDLDPYTYVLIISPLCSMCLGVCLAASLRFGQTKDDADWMESPLAVPPWALCYAWKEWVLLGAIVAFGLNTVTASFVREVSAMGYQMTSIAKDVLIVALDAHVLKDTVTNEQWYGFGLQLLLVMCWARVKLVEQASQDRSHVLAVPSTYGATKKATV